MGRASRFSIHLPPPAAQRPVQMRFTALPLKFRQLRLRLLPLLHCAGCAAMAAHIAGKRGGKRWGFTSVPYKNEREERESAISNEPLWPKGRMCTSAHQEHCKPIS